MRQRRAWWTGSGHSQRPTRVSANAGQEGIVLDATSMEISRAAVPDADAPSFDARIDPWEVEEYGELI